jgi:hypothetical protein
MSDNPKVAYNNFQEFWPVYLSEHTKAETRLVHVGSTLAAGLFLIIGVLTFKVGWILLAALVGYGGAWAAHAFIENNQPATFTQPWLSLQGDVRMTWLFVTGKLGKELAAHNMK